MRKVVLDTPFTCEDRDTQIKYFEYLLACMFNSLDLGEAPINTAYLYGLVLEPVDLKSRTVRLQATHRWISQASALVLYTDYGVSPGMALSMKYAAENGIPIEHREIYP